MPVTMLDRLLGEEVHDELMLNQWYPLIPPEKVPVGRPIGMKVLSREIVLWRSGEQIVATRNYCPHEHMGFVGAKSKAKAKIVDDTCIACAYHGWQYEGTTGKSVYYPAAPQKKPVGEWCIETYQTQICYGYVWVCLGSNPGKIPAFPEWGDPQFRIVPSNRYRAPVSWGIFILNAADVTHFSSVHPDLGDPNNSEIPPYAVQWNLEDGLKATDIRVRQQNPNGTKKGGEVSYDITIPAPHVLHFIKHIEDGSKFSMYFAMRPVTEKFTIVVPWMAETPITTISEAEMRTFQDKITGEDLEILRMMRIKRLTLDMKLNKPHIPPDKLATEYRKYLAQLGVTYGVIPVDLSKEN
jgi:vanillate O-demethylase monooxygenase subunit